MAIIQQRMGEKTPTLKIQGTIELCRFVSRHCRRQSTPGCVQQKAVLPDHLDDCAVWVDEGNPEQLAGCTMELLECGERRRELGLRLVERAKNCLSWDVIAERTLMGTQPPRERNPPSLRESDSHDCR